MRVIPSVLFLVGVTYTLTLFSQCTVASDDSMFMSLDGLRCNSCGKECTLVCGSRQFKSCCLNFIKKRKRSYLRIEVSRKRGEEPIREDAKSPWEDEHGLMTEENHWSGEPLLLRTTMYVDRSPGDMEKARVAIDNESTDISSDMSLPHNVIPHKIPCPDDPPQGN